ncbi:MnmC family methyltransferase [Methanobacterium spitsbergense]|nr:MnmC family methyltransferase [Methanobacterium spitsbergense]
MKNNSVYKPLKVQKKVLEIVDECFKKENNGDMDARSVAFDDLKEFLIETGDGSYTIKSEVSEGSSETMHTHHGGLDESLEKYVKPSHLTEKKDVHVLDICSGLGYTTAVCLEYLNNETNPEICIDMVEISPLTLATGLIIPSPVKSHEIVKKAIEDKLFSTGFLKFRTIKEKIPDNIKLNIHITDARELVKNYGFTKETSQNPAKESVNSNESIDKSNTYDAIFLAPFSPGISPELYSLEFLKGLKSMLKNDGMFLTYTAASAVRYAIIKTGLYVGEGPRFGRSGGTLASPLLVNIEKPLSSRDERMVALSDAGTPFRDFTLNDSSIEISERRQNERKIARKDYKFASTVKSPIYLCNDIKIEDRLMRRVLKDIRRLGFEDLESEKSKYIVCPQYRECICGSKCEPLENSSERVIEMEKRLNKIMEYGNIPE